MLTDEIHNAYLEGVAHLKEHISEITNCVQTKSPRHGFPVAFKAPANIWMSDKFLQNEVLGAAGIFVECKGENQMIELVEKLEGQLTIHCNLLILTFNWHKHYYQFWRRKQGVFCAMVSPPV